MPLEVTVRTIKHRWTGAELWKGEATSLGDAVKKAYLTGADLTGADLRDADLTGADLRDADLTGADLRDADLRDADLRDADLTGADLRDADLRDADLTGAVLRDADLRGADLRGAVLRDADLTGADLTPIRDDFWAVLSGAPAEVPALIAALKDGRVNGSSYSGECACLVGTIANARGCDVESLGLIVPNSHRPAEVFFLSIRQGDTPETNPFSKLVIEWATDWLDRMRVTFAPAA